MSIAQATLGAELIERSRRLVELARARGADEAEVFAVHARTQAVRFEKGDLKLAQSDEGTTLGLRVFVGQRLGFASSNQSSDAALEHAAVNAVTLARFSPPDLHNRLPAARSLRMLEPLCDPAIEAAGIGELVEHARDFVARVLARDARLSIDGASLDSMVNTQAIVSSAGVRAAESDTHVSASIGGMAIEGAAVGGIHYEGDSTRRWSELPGLLESLEHDFCEVALANLHPSRAESYQGSVLFSPDAFVDVFLAPLISSMSAIAVQRGRSPLAGKLGQRIASPLLSIDDDPTDRTLAGAGSFDREGQPMVRTALMESGALCTWLYNSYAAQVEGRISTGHARGGARGVPSLGPHALSVRAGTGGSREDLLRALGRGLWVQRFSGTVEAASGDFSGVAKSARWIEDGRVARSVGEVLISGNLYQLLERIRVLSSTRQRLSGSALAPYALVDGISVTAG